MAEATKRGGALEATRSALERWRRVHGGRGRPIPAALWKEAASVAHTQGVSATARALRVSPTKLARLVGAPGCEGVATRAPPGGLGAEAPRFVALDGLRLDARREGSVVVELVGSDGERVRVEVTGDARGVDLAALVRAFWSRGR